MADNSQEARRQAEAGFKRKQAATQDADKAWEEYEAKAQAVRDKTARLKELRLAREAADREAAAKRKPVVRRKKRSP